MNDEYLWDRTGSDPEIERLEQLLGRYRLATPAPRFSRAVYRPNVYRWLALAAAVVFLLIGVVVVRAFVMRNQWQVKYVRGSATVPAREWLEKGKVIRTSPGSELRVASRSVGAVDVSENTELELVENGHFRHILALRRGTIHARTVSAPGIFIVQTPRARAVDLGCEYTLTVDDQGKGSLHVTAGWVALDESYLESIVPAGATADIGEGGVLTPPYFEDASPAFKAAVRGFMFTDPMGEGHDRALETILRSARKRDALTLLNLFKHANRDERFLLYDRLNQLVPAPPSIPRDAMDTWNYRTDAQWWPKVFAETGIRPMVKGKKKKFPF